MSKDSLTDFERRAVVDVLDTSIENHIRRNRELQTMGPKALSITAMNEEYLERKNKLLVLRRAREKIEFGAL